MKAWQHLGFVQDSDDDAEELSDESQPRLVEKPTSKDGSGIERVQWNEPQHATEIAPECADIIVGDCEPRSIPSQDPEQQVEDRGRLEKGERDGYSKDIDDMDELQMDEYPTEPFQSSGARLQPLERQPQRLGQSRKSNKETAQLSNPGVTPKDGADSMQSPPDESKSQALDRRLEVQVVIPLMRAQIETSSSHPDWERDHALNSRSFRQRKAIQMNPYTIEQQKHRQTMSALGARPIRVQMPSQHQRQEKDDDDKEYSSSRSPSPVFGRDQSLSTGPTSVPSSPLRAANGTRRVISDDDDSLPDLDTLLRTSKSTGSLQQSNKRRKIQRQHSTKLRHTVTSTPPPPRSQFPASIGDDEDVFGVYPPSPRSVSQSPSILQQRNALDFRYPPSLVAQPLRSPNISARTKGHRERETLRNEGTNTNAEPPPTALPPVTRQIVQISDDSSGKDSSDSSSDTSQEIRGIQKRIKGVLPASWLKLDLKSRGATNKSRKTPLKLPTIQQTSLESHLGVAQKRLRTIPRERSPPSPVPVVESDTSDSGTDGDAYPFGTIRPTNSVSKPPRKSSSMPWTRFDDDPGIQMEDDVIDLMGPSTSRPHRQPQSGSKRQTKLKDAFAGSTKRIKTGHSNQAVSRERTVSSKHPRRSTKRKPKPPRLSILDAVADQNNSSIPVPQFLKIATRQARQQPNHGRQSPTTKHIRLQTRQDTEDASLVLRNWRSGKMRQKVPSQESAGQLRPPLAERIMNNQHSGPAPQPSTLRKRSSTQPILTHRQSKLQPLILQKSTQRKSPVIIDGRSKPQAPRKSHAPATSFRPAQLEVNETDLDTHQDLLRFRQGLHDADREFEAHRETVHYNPQLEAFINDSSLPTDKARSVPKLLSKLQSRVPTSGRAAPTHDMSIPLRRKPRKRLAQRVDVDTKEYRQPPVLPDPSLRSSASVELFISDQPALQDLGPYETQFTTDFDIFPLPVGTYFHETTLVGSGDFRRAIQMDHRNLDIPTARHVAMIEGRSCVWFRWDEEMATSVNELFSTATAAVEMEHPSAEENFVVPVASLVSLLRQVINLNSSSLSFFDPVDRVSCVERFLNVLEPLSKATMEKLDLVNSQPTSTHLGRLLLRANSLQLVLIQQLVAIRQQSHSCEEDCLRAQSMTKRIYCAILRYLDRHGFPEVRDFLDQNHRHSVREGGIRDDRPSVEAIVILWNICKQSTASTSSFWYLFNAEIGSRVTKTIKLGVLEQSWYNIFTVLPMLEFDSEGVLHVGLRLQERHENWEVVKSLISRVFSLYPATVSTPGSNINRYMRSMLVRCHHLIRGWGWRQCEPIIGLVFDFFARNKLAPLLNEEVTKSPLFLEVLDQHPSLDVSPDDSSFHTFLKIVGIGLRGMREIYQDKKIRGIAWRCIPNHGRTYRNDEEILSDDLAALRNNHDLLCTLYWASPPGFRLRIDTIHGLVEHSASHRAACRLNIKAWANLAKFQLSSDEPVESLDPFIAWFTDIVEQSITLYKRAPSEAQEQYEKARKAGNTFLSLTDLERTVSQNQNNVLASLVDAAAGMKSAIASAKSASSAAHLLRASGIDRIFGLFGLFGSKRLRINTCIAEVLHVYSGFLDLQSKLNNGEQPQTGSEESQDYGAWPDVEPDADERQTRLVNTLTDFISEPLAHFVSTCFGAEPAPDDTLLTTVVDTWAQLASSSVLAKEKEWRNFLDDYSAHSWNQLRDTEQTRKYGPFFLAKIAHHGGDVFLSNRSHFLSAWLTSLVERDSQLKFQHQLTTALLKVGQDDPLLQNLPFAAASRGSVLMISTTELRDRRLALISSILANMRNHFHDTIRDAPQDLQEIRAEYTVLLKQLMAAMKTNFLELKQAEEDVQGSYVNFVHKVVEFLQQYTSDICAVDAFFTDSNIFPLPANDPKYVVGRLKGYGAKFADIKAMKQLASFLLSASSRAAVDGEQLYLVSQLRTAMVHTFESGNAARPSLRSMLLQGIFPSYIQASLCTPYGWIMAKPVLQACTEMFREFTYDFSSTQTVSVDVAFQLVSSTLSTLQDTIAALGIHPELMQHGHVLHTLAAIFRVVTSMMPSLDYIIRRTGRRTPAVEIVHYIKSFTIFAAQTILGHADSQPPLDLEEVPQDLSAYKEIRLFCRSQLNDELKRWKRDGEQYSVRLHTNSWKSVDVDLGTVDEERRDVIVAVEEFHTVLASMKGLHGSRVHC